MAQQFSAGVARGDITPPIGIAHGNWSAAQVHDRAEGIDMLLFCTALAVSDGEEQAILAERELVFAPDGDWLAEIRERITSLTGVPEDHVRLSRTHTHSGPGLSQPWFDEGSAMVKPYVGLADRLVGACLAAHRSVRPARVAGGKGLCPVNANRRRPWEPGRPMLAPSPDGFSDHEVGVIRIDGDTGAPIAILVNFAAHPTILAWDNRLISPDYPGTVRKTVESLTGATCLFSWMQC